MRPYEIVVMEGGSDLVRSHKVIDCLPSAENYEPVLLEAMLQSSRKLKSA